MKRISLTNAALEGNNTSYLIADGPETVLIDTCDWFDETTADFERQLAEAGVDVADVDRIFLTHWHPDHTGFAGRIQDASGAEVYAHEADAPLIGGDAAAWDAFQDIQQEYFRDWNIPMGKAEELTEMLVHSEAGDVDPIVTPFEDGDSFSFNGLELTAVHAPGHSAGLSMFELQRDGDREVFTGDALLPEYTPNVGGADVRVDEPLAQYLTALELIAERDYTTAWPGHRSPIREPTGRAREIIDHHEERAWRILSMLADEGHLDVWSVSDRLFGHLEGIHILHGPGEAYAHLGHLERQGVVDSDGGTYEIAPTARETVQAHGSDRWPLSGSS